MDGLGPTSVERENPGNYPPDVIPLDHVKVKKKEELQKGCVPRDRWNRNKTVHHGVPSSPGRESGKGTPSYLDPSSILSLLKKETN